MRFIIILLIGVPGLITDRQISQLVWGDAFKYILEKDERKKQNLLQHTVYQSHDFVWQQIEREFDDIQVSPANSRSFRSNDCGDTFVELNTTNYYNFKLYKMNWRWLIAYKQMECEHEDMDCRVPLNNLLHFSNDGGSTWESSFGNVRDASWDKLLENQEKYQIRDQSLFFFLKKLRVKLLFKMIFILIKLCSLKAKDISKLHNIYLYYFLIKMFINYIMDDYFVINDLQDIRPYRILLKNFTKNQNNQSKKKKINIGKAIPRQQTIIEVARLLKKSRIRSRLV